MAYRRGGGAAFGIVMPETQEDNTVHSWTMSGIPTSWGPVSVREWLEKQGWSVMNGHDDDDKFCTQLPSPFMNRNTLQQSCVPAARRSGGGAFL